LINLECCARYLGLFFSSSLELITIHVKATNENACIIGANKIKSCPILFFRAGGNLSDGGRQSIKFGIRNLEIQELPILGDGRPKTLLIK
jgi:hypothetical protein